MAKLRTKSGLITLEYDSKAETIETEYNGSDRWIFKIIQLKPVAQSTLTPFTSAKGEETKGETIEPKEKELENITPEEIAVYIKNKPNFEHDTIELQERFLRRRVIARKEQKLYFAFDKLIREARAIITKEHTGEWVTSATRKSYGGRNYANVYRLKSVEEIFDEDFDPFKSTTPEKVSYINSE